MEIISVWMKPPEDLFMAMILAGHDGFQACDRFAKACGKYAEKHNLTRDEVRAICLYVESIPDSSLLFGKEDTSFFSMLNAVRIYIFATRHIHTDMYLHIRYADA